MDLLLCPEIIRGVLASSIQDGVDLVDDTVSKLSLYELLFVDHHVVTQVIETKFVVGDVGDIACVLLAALIVLHIVQNDTDGQTEESVDFAHPLSISVCQVIVDGNNVDTASGQCIQVSRKGGNKGFPSPVFISAIRP